jgi:hypothetical protein
MAVLHQALGWLSLAASFGVFALAVGASARRLSARHWIDRAILVQLACAAATIAVGLVLPIIGTGPRDGLHFVYAVVTLGGLPVARYAVREKTGPRFAGWIALAALVVIGASLRSFMTGR